MIYDRFPGEPLPAWSPDALQEFLVTIVLDPGEYDISFGFWTPGDRQRLYQEGSDDVYWINLGTFEIHE